MSVAEVQPNLEWYIAKSSARSVLPRCPFAMVDKCPRHFQSVAVLGAYGFTSLDAEEEKRLFDKWKKTDVWAAVDEDVVFVFGDPQTRTASYSKFCPEVAYERFGWFAEGLYKYSDEIDREAAYRRLNAESVSGGSWQWQWADISPRHYTECPLYAPLSVGVFPIIGERKNPIGFPATSQKTSD